MIVILLGPPGSGKGTVATRLSNNFNFRHLSTGDILREEIAEKSELGKQAKSYLESGALVPDKLIIPIVDKALSSGNLLLDGYPRTIPQVTPTLLQNLSLVIYFKVDLDTVTERISGRRVDPETGNTYHIKYIPPPADIKDRLIQRKDDLPETVKQRFIAYQKQTSPLIELFQKQGKLHEIDASLTPDQVYTEVEKLFKTFKN